MSVESAIRRARRRQAAQFTDQATVSRPIGEIAFNPSTGLSEQTYATRYTAIPCKVKVTATQGYDVNVGQTEARLIHREIEFDLEHGGQTTSFERDDIVTISDSEYNAGMIGEQYRVVDVDRRTWQVCRRVTVEEVTVPTLWEGS